MKRPNAVLVLEALLTGMKDREIMLVTDQEPDTFRTSRSIHMDGENWVLAETASGLQPCIIRPLERGTERWTTLLGVDVSLSAFIKMCDRLSDDEVFVLGCGTVLTRDALDQGQRRAQAVAQRTVMEAGLDTQVTVEERAHDWIAYPAGCPEQCESGPTLQAATRALVGALQGAATRP